MKRPDQKVACLTRKLLEVSDFHCKFSTAMNAAVAHRHPLAAKQSQCSTAQ